MYILRKYTKKIEAGCAAFTMAVFSMPASPTVYGTIFVT